MDTLTIIKNNTKIDIMQEDDPGNPRDWDNLGEMICFHNRYNLGDDMDARKVFHKELFYSPDELMDYLKANRNRVIAIPLYLMDHGGLSMRAGRGVRDFLAVDSAGWDWGMVGYIYVDYSKIREEYSVKRVSKKMLDRVRSYLIGEVETYDLYLQGRVYGYMAECALCGEELDSCWGYYGEDWEDNGLIESATGTQCDCLSNAWLHAMNNQSVCME